MRIFIVRHGDPDYEHDTVTPRGKTEVEALTKRLLATDITKVYISPLGRAQDTIKTYLKESNTPYETVDFLCEFGHEVTYPNNEKSSVPWDLSPEYFNKHNAELVDNGKWYNDGIMKSGNIKEHYQKVCKSVDDLLSKHGYERNGNIYKAVRPNTDTIAIVCHFGIEAVILSHLYNCSPHLIWENFIALPTSVTTLYSEEREKGNIIFRCCGFSDCSHLYGNGIIPSPAGRFCETHDPNNDRNIDPTNVRAGKE